MTHDQDSSAMRVDKWLKVTRLIKTRAQATKACDDRRVKVNGDIAKPAKLIRVGDVVTVKQKNSYRTFEVLGISQRSISADKARALYEEQGIELSEDSKELMQLFKALGKNTRPKYKGRPTKKERRTISKLRGW